jgi:hypothetical protein
MLDYAKSPLAHESSPKIKATSTGSMKQTAQKVTQTLSIKIKTYPGGHRIDRLLLSPGPSCSPNIILKGRLKPNLKMLTQ